jgi:hypothetical protein
LASSNSDAAVTFSAGTKDVFLSHIADAADETGKLVMQARGGALP